MFSLTLGQNTSKPPPDQTRSHSLSPHTPHQRLAARPPWRIERGMLRMGSLPVEWRRTRRMGGTDPPARAENRQSREAETKVGQLSGGVQRRHRVARAGEATAIMHMIMVFVSVARGALTGWLQRLCVPRRVRPSLRRRTSGVRGD